jgi:hypothetical protein
MVPVDPVVRVTGPDGEPLILAQVRFSVIHGGGATSDTLVLTDAQGIARTDWYVGPQASVHNLLRASVGNVSVDFTATSSQAQPGQAYFGAALYMEYIGGDLPIVISAPHGGTLVPDEIPDRTTGTLVRDTNTEELARTIGDTFFSQLGARPHIIICRLRRTKLDANREIVEAAQGNRLAQRAWYEYHAFMEAAKAQVSAGFTRGLYMDLHGHGHAIPRLELGYMLSAATLDLPDNTLASQTYTNQSSIRALVASSGSTLPQLLRGPHSLGTLFEMEGIPAVPSSAQPSPGMDEYFNGGYNTGRHGSRDGGNISGFQLESHFTGVRDNAANRSAMAVAVVNVFAEYLARHFGLDIRQ